MPGSATSNENMPNGARRQTRRSRDGPCTGFTMVEVVVMLAMFTLIAGLVLASFPALSQRINLQRSSQQLALTLRRAQNMAFAVRQVNASSGRIIPPAYGVHLTRSTPGSYVIFADLKGQSGQGDGIYKPGDDLIIETVTLFPGVTISGLFSDIDAQNRAEQVLNVTFSVPEARMAVMNASAAAGESAEAFLSGSRSSLRRSVVVRTSGQIHMR